MESGNEVGGVWEIALSGLPDRRAELFLSDPSHPHPAAPYPCSFSLMSFIGSKVHKQYCLGDYIQLTYNLDIGAHTLVDLCVCERFQ